MTLIRAPQVLTRKGSRKTQLYAEIRAGLFPPPVRLGSRYAAWLESEVDAVLKARVAGATRKQLRGIVRRLLEERRAMMPRLDV